MKSTIRFAAALALVFAAQAQAQNVSQLNIVPGMVSNDQVAFLFPAHGKFNIEPQRQALIESRLGQGIQGWALIDSTSGDIFTISAMSNGQWNVDSAEWQTRFDRQVQGQRRVFGNPEEFASRNEWRKDTATFRFSFRDGQGKYHASMCRGTGVSRPKPAVACVTATTNVKGAQDEALNGLAIVSYAAQRDSDQVFVNGRWENIWDVVNAYIASAGDDTTLMKVIQRYNAEHAKAKMPPSR